MFAFLGTLVDIGFKIGVCVVIGGALFANQTKPKDESFNETVTKDAGMLQKIGAKLALNTVAQPTFKDWVVFKTATVPENGRDLVFAGGFNTWVFWYEVKKRG
jgi:hypothetical protein